MKQENYGKEENKFGGMTKQEQEELEREAIRLADEYNNSVRATDDKDD